MFTAGFLDANARAVAVATSSGLFAYHRTTDADFSMTARTPDGTGSGWASAGARDWGTVDPAAIGRIAAQKAVASRNPQAIEPGHYTAVLEPQAVDRSRPAAGRCAQRAQRRRRPQPFSKAGGGTRIGEKVDGRARDALLRSRRSGAARPAVRRRRLAAAAHACGSRRACSGISSYSRFWAQKQGEASRPAPRVGRRARAGRRHEDAPRS